MTPPVLLIAFRRPDLVREVVSALRVSRPPVLHVFIDGARPGTDDEARRAAVRETIASGVDWPCQLRWLEPPRNLGCGPGPRAAISWFLDEAGEGVILEDDCVPGPDFLPFAARCLARYRDEPAVAQISGGCFLPEGAPRPRSSYWFSRYPHNWGWATWARAWRDMDEPLAGWQIGVIPGWLRKLCPEPGEAAAWARAFDEFVRDGRARDIWDTAWQHHCWSRGRLFITPAANLVTNIGFNAEGTHTVADSSPFANMPVRPLGPIVDPARPRPDARADALTWDHFYRYVLSCPRPPRPWQRLRMTLGRWRRDLFRGAFARSSPRS